jgi:hypothetical protein
LSTRFGYAEGKDGKNVDISIPRLGEDIPRTCRCINHNTWSYSGVGDLDHPIAFASRKLSESELNYNTIEKEGLAMVYVLQKFRHYLLGKHFNMFTDHSTLKYLVNRPVLGGTICRWILLFQEFYFEVIVKPGKLNVGPDHLSRVPNGEEPTILEDNFPNTHLFLVQIVDEYFADNIQYLSTGTAPHEYNTAQKKNLVVRVADYQMIA